MHFAGVEVDDDSENKVMFEVLDLVAGGRLSAMGRLAAALGWQSNTAKFQHAVDEQWRREVDEAVRRLEQRVDEWANRPNESRPTPGDLAAVLVAGERVFHRTADEGKRRLLREALVNAFTPELYDAGLTVRLLKVMEDLEYGDVSLLQELRKTKTADVGVAAGHGSEQLWAETLYAHHLAVLARAGLVWTSIPVDDRQWATGRFQARVTEFGKRLLELVAVRAHEANPG